jgi:hypothetical protein
VEAEVSVLCHTGAIDHTDMASKHPIIHLPVCTHSMVSHFMVLSLAQAVAGFHGVVAVAGSLAVVGGSVVGGGKAWGNRDGKRGANLYHRLTPDQSPDLYMAT